MRGNWKRFLALFLAVAMILVSGVVLTNEGFKASNDDEHVHTDECYGWVDTDEVDLDNLICGKELHEHTQDCYMDSITTVKYTCGEDHEHTDECSYEYEETFTESEYPVCGKEIHKIHVEEKDGGYDLETGEKVPCCYGLKQEQVLICGYNGEDSEESEDKIVTYSFECIYEDVLNGESASLGKVYTRTISEKGGEFIEGPIVTDVIEDEDYYYFFCDASKNKDHQKWAFTGSLEYKGINNKTIIVPEWGSEPFPVPLQVQIGSVSTKTAENHGQGRPTLIPDGIVGELRFYRFAKEKVQVPKTVTVNHIYQIYGENDEDVITGKLPAEYLEGLTLETTVDADGNFADSVSTAVFEETIEVDGVVCPVVTLGEKKYYVIFVDSEIGNNQNDYTPSYTNQGATDVEVSGIEIEEGAVDKNIEVSFYYYLEEVLPPVVSDYVVRFVEKGTDNEIKDRDTRSWPEDMDFPDATDADMTKISYNGEEYAFSGAYGTYSETENILTIEYEKIDKNQPLTYTVHFKNEKGETIKADKSGSAYPGYEITAIKGWKDKFTADDGTVYEYKEGHDADSFILSEDGTEITLVFKEVEEEEPTFKVTFNYGYLNNKGEFEKFVNVDSVTRDLEKYGNIKGVYSEDDKLIGAIVIPEIEDYDFVALSDDDAIQEVDTNGKLVTFIAVTPKDASGIIDRDYTFNVIYKKKGITPPPPAGNGTNTTPIIPIPIPNNNDNTTPVIPNNTTPIAPTDDDVIEIPTPENPDVIIPEEIEELPEPGEPVAVVVIPTPENVPIEDTTVVTVEDDGEGTITLTPVEDIDTALANQDLGHICNILYFIMLLCTTVALAFYYRSAKKHNERIFELRRELGEDDPYKKN